MSRPAGEITSRPVTQTMSRPTGPPTSLPLSRPAAGKAMSRPTADPRGARRRLRSALGLAAKLVGIPAFAIGVVLGLLYVKLLHGPVALDFLKDPIEKAIADELSGLRVRIQDVALRLSEGGKLQFELLNVQVADAGDVPLALAPSATVSLSHRALLAGRIAPESVALVSPRLSLFYSEDGKLSLKFAVPAETHEIAKTPAARSGSGAVQPPAGAGEEALGRIDLVKVLSESAARARRRQHAGAYLREVGLKSATVVIDNGSRKSIWRVPELDIDLDHRRSRSSIAGRAKIDSLTGPWTLNFRTQEQENARTLQLAVSVQGLIPRGLARTLPQLAGLESLDVQLWGDAKVELSSTGEILGGTIGIDMAPGRVLLPWLGATPLQVDGGHLALSYDRAARRFEIAPSVLVWGDSRVQFTGNIVRTGQGAADSGWSFALKSAGGWIGAEPPLLPRVAIDDWEVTGSFAPERGRIVLNQVLLRAGGGEVTAEGDVTDMVGAMKARLEGKIGAMSISTLKTLWPAPLAPRTRDWVVAHVARGWVQGGAFRLATDSGSKRGPNDPAAHHTSGSLTLEGVNLGFDLIRAWPTLEAPRAAVRVDENTFELSVPDGAFALADGRRLGVKGAFTVDMKEPLPRTGRAAFRMHGPLSAALEMLDAEPLQILQNNGLTIAGVDGKVDGQLTASMPLGQPLGPRDVTVEGKARVTEGRLGQMLGPYEVSGANIAIDMTATAAEARGEMLVNGVVAKAGWHHIFGAPADKQPPLRITANLDGNARTQLGLDVNEIVQGDVAVEVTVGRDAEGERRVHLRADLLNSEIVLDSVAWRKPRGRASLFEFDLLRGGSPYPMELRNVRLVGDDVAVEGWMGIGADNRLKEFRFPNFSLNVVTSLQAHGKMRPDGVWDVTAKGPTYDGRDLFRSFFDVSHLGATAASAKARSGLDLQADIDTVVGFSDTTLRSAKVRLQKRGNRMTSLDARGVLEGGKPFVAEVRSDAGHARRLRAEATDAGLAFKLVGFYPNAVGGTMQLEVNLDGQGPVERTGLLVARNFTVLGDPIISEVLQNADGTPSNQRRTVVREQFDFEVMRVPFEVGHGQFVMHDAVLNGQLVSASMTGKVDFRAQRVHIGGTYVPISGLMRAPAEIPLLGQVLTGPRGEGMFGITFAIKGAMARPEVIVNPLSLLTPGFTREIFQMTPEDLRIVPRDKPSARSEGPRAPGSGSGSDAGSRWSAETAQPPSRKR